MQLQYVYIILQICNACSNLNDVQHLTLSLTHYIHNMHDFEVKRCYTYTFLATGTGELHDEELE